MTFSIAGSLDVSGIQDQMAKVKLLIHRVCRGHRPSAARDQLFSWGIQISFGGSRNVCTDIHR